MDRKHSLQTFVKRTLVYRLTAVGITISLVIGLTAFFYERDRVSQETIDLAVERLSAFFNRFDFLLANSDNLEPEKFHQAVIEFKSNQRRSKLGSFVFVGVYGVKGEILTEIFDEHQTNISGVKAKQKDMNLAISSEKNYRYKILRISGVPYLGISLPFYFANRQPAGTISCIFQFSSETIKSFRLRGLRAMLSAIAIVLLTTAILYPVILRLTRRITQYSVQLLDANLDTLETLGNAIALRDSDTNAHNYRVTIYAARIGEALELPNQTMRTLIKGSFLHDVGKIGIPDEILLKPGKLDENEFEIMKTHVEQGRDMIQRSKWLHDAIEVVYSHHEKIAGSGYPRKLALDSIPVTARIFTIVDVFDALTSERPYKEAFSFGDAMEIMEEGRGSHFDPHLLDTFSNIAKPMYDKFGGKEEVFREELGDIITKYFRREMDGLEH